MLSHISKGQSIRIDKEDGGLKLGRLVLQRMLALLLILRRQIIPCVDIVGIWKERAENVHGHGTPSAHWLPEQIPDQVAEEVISFVDENLE